MNLLAAKLAEIIRIKIELASGEEGSEVRLIFHGPPLEILSQVFAILLEKMGETVNPIPVLLQVPTLANGQQNPAAGLSGRCNETHLLNLRNSPSKPTYIALVPPGQYSNKSVSTTTDEFGMLAANNSGNVAFEDWWSDELIQELVRIGITQAGINDQDRDSAFTLIEHAAKACDEVEKDRTRRSAAWRVLSRLFSLEKLNGELSPANGISLAVGVPPMRDGTISAKEQLATLEKISDALADGFSSGIRRAQEGSSEEDSLILNEFLTHLKNTCDRPTAFERAAAAFYAPTNDLELGTPPAWWMALTVEKWSELLVEDAAATGDIKMICTNGLIPIGKGMPFLVEGEVELSFETNGPDASNTTINIERTPGNSNGKLIGEVQSSINDTFLDNSIPIHRTPMRYVASADRFKAGAIKVVSLSSWAPGLFVTCRLARKLTHPKRRKGRTGPDYEASLLLPGSGRYELLVFTSPGVRLNGSANGNPDAAAERGDAATTHAVRSVRPRQFQIEVELDGSYQLDLHFEREQTDGKVSKESCRIFLSIEETRQHGCRSEFERLIRINRRSLQASEARAIVQLDRNARCSSLQDWMLSAELVSKSYMPIIMADDYVEAWVQPSWSEPAGPIFSRGRLLKDPRPAPSEFNPPADFVVARREIAQRIRGDGDETGLTESAHLGKWLDSDTEFRVLVEKYLSAYQLWLSAEPDVACWVDVVAVTSLQQDGRTLSRIPDAILLSPLHPLRLAWHAIAQRMLLESDEAEKPCPAASVLNPDCIPDILTIALRSPSGIDHVTFVSVENGSDYWSVLWNGQQLQNLSDRSQLAPFGSGFGITVGGISVGFSAAQVGRALDDVTDLLAAKAVIGVAVTGAGGSTDTCNQGLINWSNSHYQPEEGRPVRQAVGPRLVNIFDDREAGSRPDDAEIANLTEDTGNKVRWFNGQPANIVPDLGIIAQLNMSEPGTAAVETRTPLGYAALIRHRIRRQLPGAFIQESRQGLQPEFSGDALADKLGNCVTMLENLGQYRTGLSFAPNVNAIHDMLEIRKTDFVAVSSSAIDPACFLGGWLEGSYLWDYELPSYSQRAGDTSGYYLLSRVKDADREALAKALSKLPGCDNMHPDKIQEILLEIARRGIPTIRGLASEDSGATGDLGLFLAVRLLQDRFRISGNVESLLPVMGGTSDDAHIAIIVPVDPFKDYISDIARTLKAGKDTNLSRPDLIVIGVRLSGSSVRLHLTPIEVKCRPGSGFPQTEISDALDQGKNLSRLLTAMMPHEGQPRLWLLAFQHLLLSIIGFGMRVYSQHPDVVDQKLWTSFHERIASAILSEKCPITVDKCGRLLIVDDSPFSSAKDRDGDGFEETITIGLDDGGRIVGDDPSDFYNSVMAKVGNWNLLPAINFQEIEKPDIAVEIGSESKAESALESEHIVPIVSGIPNLKSLIDEEISANSQKKGLTLEVGKSVDGFQTRNISLNISDTNLNHLNMGVVGDLGTGKTQLLKSLILQISSGKTSNRGIQPRFLIFDYKRDYSNESFVSATGARVVKPRRLPINLFDTSMMDRDAVVPPWLDRYRFFADVLDKIYTGIGPVQRTRLKDAVRAAYDSALPDRPPTLYDIHAIYKEMLDGGADSILAIMDDLVDMEIFERDTNKTIPFNQLLDGVVVISLDALGHDDKGKNMVVAIMLNLFYENMKKMPKREFIGKDPQLRAIDSYLLVDEADNIMKYDFPVLRTLLLECREFGTGIILASQYLAHFKGTGTDYRTSLLTWFVHKVPNVTSAELSALGLTGSQADLADMALRVKSLQNHQCLYKSFDVSGEVIRGLPFFELVNQET